MKRPTLVLMLVCGSTTSLLAAPIKMRPVQAVNSGIPSVSYLSEGHLVAALVSETTQGQDLNEDGDLGDRILHLYDAKKRKVTNLGLEGWPLNFGEDFVAFEVPEYETGQDVDGDGHLWGYVLHVSDVQRRTVYNLGLPAPGKILSKGRSLIFGMPTNNSTAIYDVDSGILHDVGLPAVDRMLADNKVLIEVLEGLAGVDLNQDGDLDDRILHTYDLDSGEVHNTRLSTDLLATAGDWAASLISERETLEDLNGDGDSLDWIVQLFSAEDGRFLNTGLAIGPPLPEDLVTLTENRLWVKVHEYSQGQQDFNEDGDLQDNVLWFFDLESEVATNTGHAVPSSPRRFKASETMAVFLTPIGDEQHLLLIDAENGELDLGIPSGLMGLAVRDDYVYFERSESVWGDLNEDGDTLDWRIGHVYDRNRGEITNLRIALGSWRGATSDWMAMLVSEQSQNADLDGDGDRYGHIPVFYHIPTQKLLSAGLEVTGSKPLTEEILVFGVVEWRVGQDLNDDGDLWDQVLHTVTLRPEPR